MERNEATAAITATVTSSPPRSSSPPNRYTNMSLQDFKKIDYARQRENSF